MSLMGQLRGFLRALRNPSGPSQRSSLARTLKESTHVRGGQGTALPRAGTEHHHKIVTEGHQNYTESFEDED